MPKCGLDGYRCRAKNSASLFLIGALVKPLKQTTQPHWRALSGGWRFSAAVVRQAVLVLTIAFMTSTVRAAEPDLLEPERAFALSARFKDQKTVELRYKVADGYYLYRARFKFMVEPTTSAKLGIAKFSKGKMKHDPTFGWVETYRDSVRILLPVATLAKETEPDQPPLRLKVTSQGCADAGVCYPPLHQLLTLQPGSLGVVLPDGEADAGSTARSQQSTPQNMPRTLSEVLRKPM